MKSESAASASDFSALSRWTHRAGISHGYLATTANACTPAKPFDYCGRRSRGLRRMDTHGRLAALIHPSQVHDTRHLIPLRGRRLDFRGMPLCSPKSVSTFARKTIRRHGGNRAPHGHANLVAALDCESQKGGSPAAPCYSTETVASTKSGVATGTSTGAGSIATMTTLCVAPSAPIEMVSPTLCPRRACPIAA